MCKNLMLLVFLFSWSYSIGQTSYFPLEPGTKWTYAYGAEIYGDTDYEDYLMQSVILDEPEIFNGVEYFVCENSTGSEDGDKTVIKTYFRYSNDGSILTKLDKKAEEKVAMNKIPKLDDTYISQQGAISKIIDMNASITTPTKTFHDCLVIESNDVQSTSKVYYQKNIGIVAMTIVKDGAEKIFMYLLEN